LASADIAWVVDTEADVAQAAGTAADTELVGELVAALDTG